MLSDYFRFEQNKHEESVRFGVFESDLNRLVLFSRF